jgi:4-hydroxy-tetrahydrodipicolinate synthase
MKIEGPIFAILTPFDKKGDIDYGALQVYLSFLNEKGVRNIITSGTTGEFPSLALEERMALAKFCRSNFEGTVINNVSSCSTRECQSLMNHSAEYCDFFLLLPPFYYANVDDQNIIEFFTEVLVDSPNPVLLYNFPKHTKVEIKPEMLRKLRYKCANLVGIKDSGGNIDISRSFKNAKDSFQVYIGSDSLAYEALQSGFDGTVAGGGNAIPEFPVSIYNSFVLGKKDSARRIQDIFDVWNSFRKNLQLSEITTTKIALSTRIKNFPINMRSPLMTGQAAEISSIRSFMHQKVLPSINGLG